MIGYLIFLGAPFLLSLGIAASGKSHIGLALICAALIALLLAALITLAYVNTPGWITGRMVFTLWGAASAWCVVAIVYAVGVIRRH
jgi:hypothetical protein